MAERRIDDAIGRNPEDQFPLINAGRQKGFSQQAIVGRVIQLENAFEDVRVVGQPVEHRDPAIGKLRRNETMRVALVNRSSGEHFDLLCCFFSVVESYRPPRRLSRRRRTAIMAGTPPRLRYCKGGAPLNIGLELGREFHWFARRCPNRILSALKMPMRSEMRVSSSCESRPLRWRFSSK